MRNRWNEKLRRKREKRLLTKLQKARAIEHKDTVLSKPSWNRRFKAVQKLRAEQ